MAGCRKTTPNVPNEVKSYIRSVLLSKPKGIKVSQLLRDYNELVGEKLMYRKYGFASLEALLETMPDAARLAQVDGNQMIFGIPDSTSFQTISMKKASRALERLALPNGGSGDQPTKLSSSRNGNSGNGIRRNDAKKNSKNFRYGKRSSKSNKKRDSDTDDPSMRISKFNKEGNEDLDLNDPILKEPRVQRWVDQLEMDQHGRYSLVIANIKNGISEKQLMEDFSMYGNVVTTHQAMGLFFIRYQTKIEALRAMYNLKSNYDLRFGRKKKPSADVKVQEKSVENEQPPAVNGFTNGLNEVATVDICVENLPYDVGKAGISELLYLGGIPANIIGGQEIFNKPGNKSFAYLRVKGMENARKVVGALHKLEWREHTLTAKMPEHVAQPSQPIVLSPGAKRKILLQSAFAALQHDQNKCQRNDEESDYDDDDDDIRDMPDLEASAYEDDEMFKKRNYVSKEEENDDTEDDSDDDDDFFEMPELEAIPLSVSVKEDKPPLISSPPAKEASRVGSQQDLSPPCDELDRLHLQKQSPVKSPNRQEGKTNLTVKSPPSKATKAERTGPHKPRREDWKKRPQSHQGRYGNTPPQQFVPSRPAGLLPLPGFAPTPVPFAGSPLPSNDGMLRMTQDINLVVAQMMNSCFPGIPFWTATDLPDDFEVFVTCVMNGLNPPVFWGQLVSRDAKEDVEALQRAQKAFPSHVEPYRGSPYCAAQNMGEWRRACILTNLPQGAVKVFFIDYGNIATLNVTDLGTLPDQFWILPPQALPFCGNSNFVGRINDEDVLVACKKPQSPIAAPSVVFNVAIVLKK